MYVWYVYCASSKKLALLSIRHPLLNNLKIHVVSKFRQRLSHVYDNIIEIENITSTCKFAYYPRCHHFSFSFTCRLASELHHEGSQGQGELPPLPSLSEQGLPH